MKYTRYISIILVAVLGLTSCKKNTPKEVANQWLTDFYHLDYDAAKKLSTEETKNLLSQIQQLASMIPDSTKQSFKKATVTVKQVTVNGDNANVTYVLSDNPTLEQPLKLVKINGQWLVLFTKEDQPDPSSANIIPDNTADSTSPAPADTTNLPADTTTH